VAGGRRALVVAVDGYDHPGLRRLPSAAADADALASVLGDPAVAGFDVEVVRNQPAHEIEARIEDLFADARADDVLLLHFSGHGLKSEAGELYFAASATRPDRLASTAVPAEFVQRCLRASASRSVVLLLDCCYGGAFGQGVSVRAAGEVNVADSFPSGRLGGGRGRAVISASNAMEYAFEGDRLRDDAQPEPSLFTAALVRGLATGEADRDEDGWVSLNELYDYVFDKVRSRNPNQTPTRDIEMQGELYLARSRRRRIAPAPLPGDLQAAMDDANPYTRLGAVAELRARLLSDNLPVAAGAHAALAAMAAADTRLVGEAASAALQELQLGISPVALDFGPVPAGERSASQRLLVTGPPLARAVSVSVTEPWIRIEERDGAYDVAVVPESPAAGGTASVDGAVTVSGPAGALRIPVTARLEGRAGQAVETAMADTAVTKRAVESAGRPAVAVPPLRPGPPEAPPSAPGRAASASWAAWLAIGVGGLAAVALVADTLAEDLPVQLFFVLHPAVLVVGGVCALRPASRTVGLGLVAGAGAASVLPAMLLVTGIGAHAIAQRRWALLVLLLVLLAVVGAGLAAAAAARLPGARLDRALLRRPAGLVVLAAALVGSFGLVVGASDFSSASDGSSQWLIPACWWSAVVALVAPPLAAAVAPDRLRAGTLAGWVVGAGGFHLAFLGALSTQNITFDYRGFLLQLATLPLLLAGALPVRAAGAVRAGPAEV
jgi:Caspase domain